MAVDLKVRDLEMVVLLADTLNFHVAADALGISQPAVTKRLQELERHVRARLFDRDHSSLKGLTSHGHRFLRRARLSAEHCRLGIIEVQLGVDQDDPPFRAGRSPDIDRDLISLLHAVSLPMFPDLHLECSTDFSADLVTALLEERLEIALVVLTSPDGKNESAVRAPVALPPCNKSRSPVGVEASPRSERCRKLSMDIL